MKELLNCKNVKILGMWKDPEGKFSPMPLFEINEDSAEEWNRKVREREKRHENKGRYKC